MQTNRIIIMIVDKLKKFNKGEEIDFIFQYQNFNPNIKKFINFSECLLSKAIIYIILRQNALLFNDSSQSEIVQLQHSLKNMFTFNKSFQNFNNYSGHFLHSLAVLVQIIYKFMQDLALTELRTPERQNIFIILVFISTDKLISPKCYEIVMTRLRKKHLITFKSYSLLKSTRRTKRQVKLDNDELSCLQEFKKQLRENLRPKIEKQKILKTRNTKRKIKSMYAFGDIKSIQFNKTSLESLNSGCYNETNSSLKNSKGLINVSIQRYPRVSLQNRINRQNNFTVNKCNPITSIKNSIYRSQNIERVKFSQDLIKKSKKILQQTKKGKPILKLFRS